MNNAKGNGNKGFEKNGGSERERKVLKKKVNGWDKIYRKEKF